MFRNASRMIRRAVAMAVLTSAATFALPAPGYASTESCYDKVIMDCANAMEDSRWYERFALGVICSGLLAGCALS